MVQRFKVFAKLQTAQDYEVLIEGLLCKSCVDVPLLSSDRIDEQNLRKRITELQEYRRMGVTTAQEADAYETAKAARVSSCSESGHAQADHVGRVPPSHPSYGCAADWRKGQCWATSFLAWDWNAYIEAW
jgi:hypothetical protein